MEDSRSTVARGCSELCQRHMTRRVFVSRTVAAAAAGALSTRHSTRALSADSASPMDIGVRRELFVEGSLVERLGGAAVLQLHHPEPHEVVLVHDAPWEGSGSGFHSVFRDGDLYRMYYKAWYFDVSKGRVKSAHPGYCCYAESNDGILWRKPELGLIEFNGSKANNILIATGQMGSLIVDAAHPAVCRDENPDAPADARYKATFKSGTSYPPGPVGMVALKSPDGIHWSPMSNAPIISKGAFDSQNLAFWDSVRKEYRAYYRIFTGGVTNDKVWKPSGVRAIRTATSKDFLHWGEPTDLTYVDSPAEHLYTNQIKPYYRAPHLFIGFPTRYVERGWSPSMRALPDLQNREWRAAANLRYGTALTEGLLMASRDGVLFKRWNEAFLRPGIEREGTWSYGQQYIAWHVVETRSALTGAPNELSLYACESYWTGNSSATRRYTLRLDGFVSVSAPWSGGEVLTRLVRFQGSQMRLNFSTSAAGVLRVEIQNPAGQPIPGFTEADSDEVFGDAVDRAVTWKNSADVSTLTGMAVRLRFVLKDADLYAFRFCNP
jgi:hypothetical protein